MITCLWSMLLLASVSMSASAVSEEYAGVVDMDGDGDVDQDDYASWKQQQVHSELERVSELPWWVVDEKEYYASNGGGRSLAVLEDEEVDEELLLESLAEKMLTEEEEGHRRTTTRSTSIPVVDGYCLPPRRRIVTGRATCRAKRQLCGLAYVPCCAGLACRKDSDGSRRCRSTCKGDGRECSASANNCCSKQCVLCKDGCQGRCGLGIERPRDNIQVRRCGRRGTYCFMRITP